MDVQSVSLNNQAVAVGSGTYTASNGKVYAGQNKMHWNGSYTLGAAAFAPAIAAAKAEAARQQQQAEQRAPNPGDSSYHTVKIDLAAVHGNGAPSVDIYINGQKALAGHAIQSRVDLKQKETVTLEGNYGQVKSIEVVYNTDNGPRRVDINKISVDGHTLDLGTAQQTNAKGETFTGMTKMHWNGKLHIDVPAEANNMPQAQQPPQPSPPAEQPAPAPAAPPAPVNLHNDFGGADTNHFRGEDYVGRTRPKDDPHDATGETIVIHPGITVAEIKALIASVPESTHLILQFAEGRFHFTEQLLIQRGNITVAGMGEGKTTIVADFADGMIDNLIQIQGPNVSTSTGTSNGSITPAESNLIGSASEGFALGDRALHINGSLEGLKAGDHIMVYKQGTTSTTDGKDEFSTLAEISAIHGDRIELKHGLAFGSNMLNAKENLSSVKVYKVDLLENVTVRDFSITYNIHEKHLHNPLKLSLDTIKDTIQYNFYGGYAAYDGVGKGELVYGHHRALVISGTNQANVENIGMKDIGSSGFFFSGNLQMYGNNLSVDGTHNKGSGGNGYGLEYDKTYYSDFTDLSFYGLRHSVTAQMLGGNGFNNFHVTDTDTNLDFHGGRDQGNIYYIENMTSKSYYLPKMLGSTPLADADALLGRVQFGMISYRQGDLNAKENLVLFGNANGNDGTFSNGIFVNGAGEKMAAYNASYKDYLMASDKGATLKAGFGSDTLISGKGDDFLFGGNGPASVFANSDRFVFRHDSGNDVVDDFDIKYDKILVERHANGTGIESGRDILSHAVQSGANVVVDLGQGNHVTILDTHLSSLTASNFDVFTTLPPV